VRRKDQTFDSPDLLLFRLDGASGGEQQGVGIFRATVPPGGSTCPQILGNT